MFKSRGHEDEITSSRSKTIEAVGLKHGDILYLEPLNGAVIFEKDDDIAFVDDSASYINSMPSTSRASTSASFPNGIAKSNSSLNIVFPNNQIVEDEVDQSLWKSDGKIKRQRDPKLWVSLGLDNVYEFILHDSVDVYVSYHVLIYSTTINFKFARLILILIYIALNLCRETDVWCNEWI